MVSIRRMTEDEFRVFLPSRVESFATDMVMGRGWLPDGANAKSSDWHSRLLHHGLSTPNHYFYTVRLEHVRVGDIWLAIEGPSDSAGGYIYHFCIDRAFRRRGIGSKAIALLENEASHLSLFRLALHLFSYNVAAIQFFRKVGFRDVTMKVNQFKMAKSLGWTG
jgi:RimJ/RimL family protein N-acetyltransferase